MRRHTNKWRAGIAVAIIASVLIGFGTASDKLAYAAGTASFGMSPTGGTYTVGDTINVAISETSSPSDNTNAAQVNLTFPTSLSWQSTTPTGPFTLCAQNSHTATTVSLACAASSAQSGTQAVATISFKVVSAGSAVVAMAAGSDIASTSGSSVFNGSLPSATFTLVNPVAATPPPASTPTSTPKSTTSTAPKTTTPTPTPSTTTATTATPTTTADDKSTGSLSVTVRDSAGNRLQDADVKLDQQTATTNANGVANFSGVSSGKHTLHITALGKQPLDTTVTIGAGENKLVSHTLSDKKPLIPNWAWYVITGIGGLLLGVGGVALYLKFRRPPPSPPSTPSQFVTY